MKIRCVWEHNGDDTLLYAVDYVGAFTRGASLEEAMEKMKEEVISYLTWENESTTDAAKKLHADENGQDVEVVKKEEMCAVEIVQEKASDLHIADADSDVIFKEEKQELTREEYERLKELALKSAQDFLNMYEAIPDKEKSCLPERKTFYGAVPRTAQEMYEHTKSVNAYYFSEIGVDADNEGTIYECRKRGFELLEQSADFLKNPVIEGSYDELWSVRKMLRRFLWHDRIHGKAMYRMAVKTFGQDAVKNVFDFVR